MHPEPQRLNLEPWRFNPGALEARPGALKARPGALEAHTEALKAYTEIMLTSTPNIQDPRRVTRGSSRPGAVEAQSRTVLKCSISLCSQDPFVTFLQLALKLHLYL